MSNDDLKTYTLLRNTPEIFAQLAKTSQSGLKLQKELREQFADEIVRAALLIHELREKAATKFSLARQMWFTSKALEQATSEDVAIHKAQRFSGLVWDYCCGIGGDAIAQAGRGNVIAVDSDPLCCLFTKWNAEAYGRADNVEQICADVTELTDRTGLLHIDPDRRTKSQRRSRRVEDGLPNLETLQQLSHEFTGGAIKLSPASNFGGKFDDAEIEIVSLRGEAKEAVVWFGELAKEQPFRATVLPQGASLAGHPLDAPLQVGPLGQFVYDPDPAIVRAGLIDLLAEQEGLLRLDDAEEYLTSDKQIETPFATPFELLAECPNNPREIRNYFRTHNFGNVEIKCRHVPIDAESVRRKLPLNGEDPAVLIFARLSGKTRALICRRLKIGTT